MNNLSTKKLQEARKPNPTDGLTANQRLRLQRKKEVLQKYAKMREEEDRKSFESRSKGP
jgi:hypothetical protein